MSVLTEEEKRQRYESNPKTCSWCGKPVPFERRLGGFCSEECARQHANARHRKQYWAEKPKIQARHAKYYQDHKEERRAHQKEYDAANPNRHKDYYYAHQDEILAKKREDYAADPEKMRERNRRTYDKRKCGKGVCAGCGVEFIKTSNVQVLCPSCRQRRHDALYGQQSVYRADKNGSIHRQVLRDLGILDAELEARGYAVHHMDGNRSNNDPMNLYALAPSDHSKIHHLIEKEWITHQDMTMEQLSEYVMMKYNFNYY